MRKSIKVIKSTSLNPIRIEYTYDIFIRGRSRLLEVGEPNRVSLDNYETFGVTENDFKVRQVSLDDRITWVTTDEIDEVVIEKIETVNLETIKVSVLGYIGTIDTVNQLNIADNNDIVRYISSAKWKYSVELAPKLLSFNKRNFSVSFFTDKNKHEVHDVDILK